MIAIRPYTKTEEARIERTIEIAARAADDRVEEYEDEHGELKPEARDELWNRFYHEEMNCANDRIGVKH
jgi:hypothetical protein